MHCSGQYLYRFEALLDEEVVVLAHEGTPGATEALLDRYRSLVETKARSYFVRGADRDDVVQEGMIGLCKAIRDYRSERSTRFRPFAELCVTRQIISAIKAATRHKHNPLNVSLSLNQGLGEETQDLLILDLIADPQATNPETRACDVAWPANLIELMERKLSPLERGVLTGFLDGKTYEEISHDLERHTKAIDNALQRVKRKVSLILNG